MLSKRWETNCFYKGGENAGKPVAFLKPRLRLRLQAPSADAQTTAWKIQAAPQKGKRD